MITYPVIFEANAQTMSGINVPWKIKEQPELTLHQYTSKSINPPFLGEDDLRSLYIKEILWTF